MNHKKTLRKIRGWLPKEYHVAFAQKMSKPIWWKPLWIVSVLGIIISALVLFLIGYTPLERIILGVVFAFLGLGVAYYIRVRPSITVNRVVYIGLGIGIGWVMFIIYAVSGIGRWVTDTLGVWPSLIIGFAVLYIVGALIGDRIGKRRNYQLPLSP
jgi:peptidoglycan/LPS O-acetylase OafA/YrhL